MKRLFLVSIPLLIFTSLAACGQMGPLYLPDQKPPIHVPKPEKNT